MNSSHEVRTVRTNRTLSRQPPGPPGHCPRARVPLPTAFPSLLHNIRPSPPQLRWSCHRCPRPVPPPASRRRGRAVLQACCAATCGGKHSCCTSACLTRWAPLPHRANIATDIPPPSAVWGSAAWGSSRLPASSQAAELHACRDPYPHPSGAAGGGAARQRQGAGHREPRTRCGRDVRGFTLAGR
jgi:hypothetical protein